MSAVSVLLLDDDAAFRAIVAGELRNAGFAPTEATTIAEAEACVLDGQGRFDLLILDVILPDGDGRDLCARLRTMRQCMPVVILTGSDTEEDVVNGLNAGAHDYLPKSVRPSILIARLRAHLRHGANCVDAVHTVGRWKFHPAQKELCDLEGRRISLTSTETDILRYLLRAGGVASKKALLGDICGYHPTARSHALANHIHRLRQKIEADPHNARILVTTRGGYRLAAPAV